MRNKAEGALYVFYDHFHGVRMDAPFLSEAFERCWGGVLIDLNGLFKIGCLLRGRPRLLLT
jgi:hypothetical protein